MNDPHRFFDAERTVRENARQDDLVLEGVARREVKDARDRWLLGVSEAPNEGPVQVFPPAVYALPALARKVLTPQLVADLEQLLEDLRRLNDGVQGIPAQVAMLLLAADEEALHLRARFRAWAEAYVAARLAKPSVRDRHPVSRFKRLYLELLPWLEEVATRQRSAHYVSMGEVLDYIPWLIFQATWADRLVLDFREGPPHFRWRVEFDDPVSIRYCQELVRLYAWTGAGSLERALRAYERRGGRRLAAVEEAAAVDRVAALAAEIREVRPFVVSGHNPEKCHVEVAPGLWASWLWGGAQQLGIVPIHDDHRARLKEHRDGNFTTLLRVGQDGVLASEFTPWLDALDLPGGPALCLAVVEGLHARLLQVFDRVDLDAVYQRVREESRGQAGEAPPSQEALAGTFTVAEPSPPAAPVSSAEPVEPAPTPERPRVPTLRMERFLALLARLGCEVRQGKGSEVVVHRAGGKIARLGRHTRNPQVSSVLAQRVLHQVGVTLTEWLAVLE